MGTYLADGWFPDIDDSLEYKPVADGSYAFVYDAGYNIFWILHHIGRSADSHGNYVFIYEVCNSESKYDGLRFDIPLKYLNDAPQYMFASDYDLMPRTESTHTYLRDSLRSAMRVWRARNIHNNKHDGFEWLED